MYEQHIQPCIHTSFVLLQQMISHELLLWTLQLRGFFINEISEFLKNNSRKYYLNTSKSYFIFVNLGCMAKKVGLSHPF